MAICCGSCRVDTTTMHDKLRPEVILTKSRKKISINIKAVFFIRIWTDFGIIIFQHLSCKFMISSYFHRFDTLHYAPKLSQQLANNGTTPFRFCLSLFQKKCSSVLKDSSVEKDSDIIMRRLKLIVRSCVGIGNYSE